jgi:CHASE2 domain-containing sensor protein
MPPRTGQPCGHRQQVEALAAGDLTGAAQRDVEQHLEQCEPCRAHFRQLTADRFPRFRGYTILAELGRGGFGHVYKAIHHGKARVEAMKVLFGKTPLREAYFENEVHLVARLRHPYLATLYEAHLNAPPLYYTMEYVAGQQLDAYLHSHDVSLEERIEIIKKVATAVAYAHGQGVVHRDLKPQNILIDPQNQPRIVDFGISKRLGLAGAADTGGASPRTEGALGTYGYMAPEQIAGGAVDARADIYALGVLLFHVITGLPARSVAEPDRLLARLRERHVSRADDLAAIITHAARPAPEERYPTCLALVADLDRYLAGREVQAQTNPTAGYHAIRLAALVLRTYPRSVQVAATAVIVATLTLAFWTTGARWCVAGTGQPQTALIAVTPDTLTAAANGRIGAALPGFDPNERPSWRLLYGRLLEKLAEAGPRVVVWDYTFRTCDPRYDAALVRGIRNCGVPVVVGSAKFDVNGEPQLCAAIHAAAQAWGLLLVTRADTLRAEVNVPLALQRGFNPAIPSLALAGFAAARFPDCDVDIDVQPTQLELRYRRRHVAAGERRWRGAAETDRIPIFSVDPAGTRSPDLEAEDRPAHGRFRLDDVAVWAQRAIPLEQVLTAEAQQVRAWFGGRAVLVGQMLPGLDQHELRSDQTVFGCQVQTAILDALLAGAFIHRVDRPGLLGRVCVWCALASLAAGAVPLCRRGAVWPVLASAAAAMLTGILLTFALAGGATSAWAVEATIAGCALLSAGGLAVFIRQLHERQLHLAPTPVWLAGSTTTSTTVLVGTPRGSASRSSAPAEQAASDPRGR